MVAAAPSVLDFVEGAPWWVKTIVGVLALLAPIVVPRVLPDRKARAGSEDDPDEEDLRELRDQLVKYLQRAERAERELAIAKAEANHLKSIVDALIDRRGETPPQGTPRPGP